MLGEFLAWESQIVPIAQGNLRVRPAERIRRLVEKCAPNP
jgi:hypothetical protein